MLLHRGLQQKAHQPLFRRRHFRLPSVENLRPSAMQQSNAPNGSSIASGAAVIRPAPLIQQYRQSKRSAEQVRRTALMYSAEISWAKVTGGVTLKVTEWMLMNAKGFSILSYLDYELLRP